jgi:hypothetical protein
MSYGVSCKADGDTKHLSQRRAPVQPNRRRIFIIHSQTDVIELPVIGGKMPSTVLTILISVSYGQRI